MKLPRFHIRMTDRLANYRRLHVGCRVLVETAVDRAVQRFLIGLDQHLSSGEPGDPRQRLWPFRDDFRRIINCEPLVGLALCLQSGSREQRRLAIWLLGRMGRRAAISMVAVHRWDPDVRIRRRVARALVRMEGWQYLREIAREEFDPVARHLATLAERPPRPFSERVGRYLARDVRTSARSQTVDAGAPPCFLGVRIGGGLPPRSPEFLRAILERLRQAVASSRRVL